MWKTPSYMVKMNSLNGLNLKGVMFSYFCFTLTIIYLIKDLTFIANLRYYLVVDY